MQWSTTVTIDAPAYPLQVVHKATYALADTLSILILQSSPTLELRITPVDSATPITEAEAQILLARALNDFALREQILKETSGLRELLARTALKEAGI